MDEKWGKAVITDIKLAIHVVKGEAVHKNRTNHGLVFDDENSIKFVEFSDGTILKIQPFSFYYLPQGSDYVVKTVNKGSCWAINFELNEEIDCAPFVMNFRNPDRIRELFEEATRTFKENKSYKQVAIRKILYEIILLALKEKAKSYVPNDKELIIKPAVDMINKKFADNELSVRALADICKISEAYFRRIFTDVFSISPKDYIIKKRMDYAKSLLSSGQVEVNQAAVMCGYFEPCHFSREFSKHVGVSPKEYIKRNSDSL